jgi:hypothetical protein
MPNCRSFFALLALLAAVSAGFLAPASAGSNDQPAQAPASYNSSSDGSGYSYEFAAQSRTRITIHPRRTYPGRNAKRHCRSWLAKEYRVSGPVIVPQMRCWWD